MLALPRDVLAGNLLGLLAPADFARLSICSKRLREVCVALDWRGHCLSLLGPCCLCLKPASKAFWHGLYASARNLEEVHWHEEADSISHKRSLLARSGHAATQLGDQHILLLGGLMRDGPAALLDIAVLDVASGSVSNPKLFGQPPATRSHLCSSEVKLQEGSLLHGQVLEAVQDGLQQLQQQHASSDSSSRQAAEICSQGHTLVVFGGLQLDGSEAGGSQLDVLWLSADVGWGCWLSLTTTGPAPAPRAYACSQSLDGGSTVLVYAGLANGTLAGTAAADVAEIDGYLLLCVYLLQANSLTWSRQPTRPLNEPPRVGHVMLGPSTCPGPRKQALSCLRVSPSTGREEFVVLGGCGKDGLADFVPYALDTTNFVWSKGSVTGYLPAPRDAGALLQLGPDWMLLLGGRGPQRDSLADIQRLHLPTLSWRPPPKVAATAEAQRQALSSSFDFTATAGIVVGGTREGPYGSIIMPRFAMLLPGPPPPGDAGGEGTQLVLAGIKGTTGAGKVLHEFDTVAPVDNASRFKAFDKVFEVGYCKVQAPAGWSSEIEIEPASTPAEAKASFSSVAGAAGMAPSSDSDAVAVMHYARREWQAGKHSGWQKQQLMEVLLACAVFVLGLLLAYPSAMMQLNGKQ